MSERYALEYFVRCKSLLGERNRSPLGKTVAGAGRAVAVLREKRLDRPLTHDVTVEYLIDNLADVFENVALGRGLNAVKLDLLEFVISKSYPRDG